MPAAKRRRGGSKARQPAGLDRLIEEASTDCYGDEDCVFQGLVNGIEERVAFPFVARSVGLDVDVLGVDDACSGLRVGVIMRVARGGRTYRAALAALEIVDGTRGREHIEAYLQWAGVGPLPNRQQGSPRAPFTARQGQYLAYIVQYTRVHGYSPSENEIAAYFAVSGPAAHGMVVAMDRRGLIERKPGVARSIRVRVPPIDLPDLAGPANPQAAGPRWIRRGWQPRE